VVLQYEQASDLELLPEVSDSVRSEWGTNIFILNKFPGNAVATAGLGTTS
jgi:hypothetical protein